MSEQPMNIAQMFVLVGQCLSLINTQLDIYWVWLTGITIYLLVQRARRP